MKWLVWNSGLVFSRESPGVLNGLLERHPIIGIQFFLAPALTGIVRIMLFGVFLDIGHVGYLRGGDEGGGTGHCCVKFISRDNV